MKTCILTREIMNSKQGTLGALDGTDGFSIKTGELPWKNNRRNVSCIPLGIYDCVWNADKKKYDVLGVPNRTGIQIEIGNRVSDILGCILTGKQYHPAPHPVTDWLVMNSKIAFEELRKHAGDQFQLIVSAKMQDMTDENRVLNFRGTWKEAMTPTRVSLAKTNEVKREPRPAWKEFLLSKRIWGVVIGAIGLAAEGYDPALGELVLQFAAALEGLGIIHAAYKSKPGTDGRAGWFYRFVDWLFTLLGSTEKKKKK